jgi:hypothetical protein
VAAAVLLLGVPTASFAGEDAPVSTDTSISDSDVVEPTADTGTATDDTAATTTTTTTAATTDPIATATSIDSPTSDEYTSNTPPEVTGGGPPTEVVSVKQPVEGGGTPEVLAEAVKPAVIGGGLPFTGLGIAMLVALGSALVGFGAIMQLQARRAAKRSNDA